MATAILCLGRFFPSIGYDPYLEVNLAHFCLGYRKRLTAAKTVPGSSPEDAPRNDEPLVTRAWKGLTGNHPIAH